MEGETLSESALNNRVLDYTRKAEGLIGDMGQVYAEVLTTVTDCSRSVTIKEQGNVTT